MRSFVAIELPTSLKEELESRVTAVRCELPAARWVAAGNYHLTLRFLGEIDDSQAGAVAARLEAVFEHTPSFALQASGGGCFPARRPARVAWVGFAAASALLRLQTEIEVACDRVVGGEGHGRRYQPHLTLARCRDPWRRSAVERWVEVFDGPIGRAFTVSRGVLMRSRLSPAGARYSPVRVLPLAPAAGAVR